MTDQITSGSDPAVLPPPPAASSVAIVADDPGPTSTSRVAAVFVGLVAAAVAIVTGLVLAYFLPSFWLAMGIAMLILLAVIQFLDRSMHQPWALMMGPVLFAILLGWIAGGGIGDEPRRPKPEPWDATGWEGTQVEHWELSTGSRIGYVRFEPANPIDAAPVLFLHGGPAGGIVPQDGGFARELADQGFDVYVYDQAGVGWSDLLPVEEYRIDRMVDDLEAIRQEIGVEQVNLIGHSWGGSLAAHYLVAHDEHVERAWLSNPGDYGGSSEKRDPSEEPNLTAATQSGLPFEQRPPIRMILALGLGFTGANSGSMQDLVTQEQMVRYVPDYIDQVETFQETRCANNPYTEAELAYVPESGFNMYAFLQISDDVVEHDPRQGLETIQTPVVVARGECDHLPWDSHRLYRDHVPGAQLIVIPNEGHDMRPADDIGAFFESGQLVREPYTSDEVPGG